MSIYRVLIDFKYNRNFSNIERTLGLYLLLMVTNCNNRERYFSLLQGLTYQYRSNKPIVKPSSHRVVNWAKILLLGQLVVITTQCVLQWSCQWVVLNDQKQIGRDYSYISEYSGSVVNLQLKVKNLPHILVFKSLLLY